MSEDREQRFDRLDRWLPGIGKARAYRSEWLAKDLVAGLVLIALLVPQGMAYAELAGLPPVNGLYASMIPLLAYAVLGPSRILVPGSRFGHRAHGGCRDHSTRGRRHVGAGGDCRLPGRTRWSHLHSWVSARRGVPYRSDFSSGPSWVPGGNCSDGDRQSDSDNAWNRRRRGSAQSRP